VSFYVLDSGIIPTNKDKIKQLEKKFSNFSIEFIKIDISKTFTNTSNFCWTDATYSRLLIPSLKPDLDKVIYMDVDICAFNDICRLYQEDLSGHIIGATEACFAIHSCKKIFNAGVLLIDCKKWREKDISNKITESYNKLKRDGKGYTDTDILFDIFLNDFKFLSPRYNYNVSDCEINFLTESFDVDMLLSEKKQITLRHYMVGKPWRKRKQTIDNSVEFFAFAKMTPFWDEIINMYKNKKYPRFFIHLLCAFIPNKKIRKRITRKYAVEKYK
jgi:lipopolysaccharide biosynthesis glycosyltransferase